LFPTSQDHKRALDNDEGLNTGGMGTYSPTPFLTDAQVEQTGRAILEPWLKGCAAAGIDFRGLLYPGIMLTKSGPKVLEFNARFGDPETQVYVMRLETDLVELLNASVDGTLNKVDLKWKREAAVCVVMASGGYPGSYQKGVAIDLPKLIDGSGMMIFHAGTTMKGDGVVTNGGRVLGVTALGKNLSDAQQNAYALVEQIRFEGAHYRKDIAAKALTWRRS
jgi:phosphoribosylamine---glycine ligase